MCHRLMSLRGVTSMKTSAMYGFYQVGKLWVWGMGHGALVLSVAVGAASRREVWGMGHLY
jgi:hypothetical protein